MFLPQICFLSPFFLSSFTRRTGRLFGLAAVDKLNLFEALFNPFGEARLGNQSVCEDRNRSCPASCYLSSYICSFGEKPHWEAVKGRTHFSNYEKAEHKRETNMDT